jgi:hypothetical protein
MTGPVSKYLTQRLETALRTRRVVIWYDRERAFESLFEAWEPDGIRKLRLEESYFRLRREAEPLVADLRDGQGGDAPVLIYVPRERIVEKQNVLLPLEVLGRVHDQTLRAAARAALKDHHPPEKIRQWLDSPGVSLSELDELSAGEQDIGPLEVVFGKVGPQEVGLRLLRDSSYALQAAERGHVEDLRELLDRTFGVAVPPKITDPEPLRDAFAQRVLLHEFLDDLREIPSELREYSPPEQSAQLTACRELAAELRRIKPLEEEYRRWAAAAVDHFGLDAGIDYDAEQLGRRDTFEFEADYALRHVRDLAVEGRWGEAAEWVRDRSTSFWAETDQLRRSQWRVARLAVDLWLTAERQQGEMPSKKRAPRAWVEWYTTPETGAWRADLLQRRLDEIQSVVWESPELADVLSEIVTRARAQAERLEQTAAERFLDCLSASGGDLSDLPLQQDIFQREVAPRTEQGKTVFVLADALRYEMAEELRELLSSSGEVELSHAVATPPTITVVGMAALTPGAENGLELTAGEGGLVPRVAGEALPDLARRRKRYQAALGDRVADLTLDDLRSRTQARLEEDARSADLLLLRVQDLDQVGELDNLSHARAVMNQVIKELQQALQRLARVGFKEFVVCADHGFLLRGDISDAMKLDLPDGEIIETHRRCVIGRHLAASDNHAVFRAADFGLGGDLELAFPRGINVFKTAGNLAYHHGGLSLQELIVPVLRYTAPVQQAAKQRPSVTVSLQGAPKITNAFFQVELVYQAGDLFDQQGSRRFRVTAREAKKAGDVVGTTMQATKGFRETGAEVELSSGESSVLIIFLTDPPTGEGKLKLVVDDVETGEAITTETVEYDLAF